MIIKRLKNNITATAIIDAKIDSQKQLVNGDNIVLTPQGSLETFINTTNDIKLDSLTARNGVIDINSETHFKNIPHCENGIIFDYQPLNIASEIQFADNDLKMINTNGDILLSTKTNLVSVDDLAKLKAPDLSTYLTKTEASNTYTPKSEFNSRIDDISLNHRLAINANDSAKWEGYLSMVQLSPSDPSKGTVEIVPSTINPYELNHKIGYLEQQVQLLHETIKTMIDNQKGDIHFQVFNGAEDKDNDPRTYGYITRYGNIPLRQEVGVLTFGNIYNVDYNQWDGIYYNNELVKWNTNSSDLVIQMSGDNFQATKPFSTITLFKEYK